MPPARTPKRGATVSRAYSCVKVDRLNLNGYITLVTCPGARMFRFLRQCCTPICADVLRPRALALTIAAVAAAQLAAGSLGWGIPCFFHRFTGLPCPGCGLTRSVLALLHGHVHEAFLLHPFGPLALLVLVMSLATAVMPDTWRQPVLHFVTRCEQRAAPAVVALVLLFVLWGLRIGGLVSLAPV